MQRDGLGCLRLHGRTEGQFAVVRGDKVQQMQAHVLVVRLEIFPLVERERFPQRIDQLDADIDVTKQFAALVERHGEAPFLDAILPHLAAVVEKDTGDQQVAVQDGIGRRDGVRIAHHLRHMLDEPAAPRVMKEPCRSRAAEARAEFFEEGFAQRFEPRLFHRGHFGLDELVIFLLPRAQVGGAGQKFLFGLAGQRGKTPALGLEAELRVHREFAFELEARAGRQFLRRRELPVVRPDAQDKAVPRIDQLDFEERLAVFGGFLGDRINEHRQDRAGPPRLGVFAQGGDVGQFSHGDQTPARARFSHASRCGWLRAAGNSTSITA